MWRTRKPDQDGRFWSSSRAFGVILGVMRCGAGVAVVVTIASLAACNANIGAPGASSGAGQAGSSAGAAPGAGGSSSGGAANGGAVSSDLNAVGLRPLSRLNRREYNNTVRDLLGDSTRPADQFADGRRQTHLVDEL